MDQINYVMQKVNLIINLQNEQISIRNAGQIHEIGQNSNKEAIWFYAELFLGHHDGSCHGLWWFVVIHVMLCAGFCHGWWWFMSWFVVICSDLWFVGIHIMENLWWFIVICDDSCHHL